MAILVLLALVLFLAAEFYGIGRVMDGIGILATLLLLVIPAMVGGRLAKRQGLATLGNMAAKLEGGAAVGLDLVQGGLLLVAGLLFVFPGFISDAMAVLLLLPPVRAVVAVLLVSLLRRHHKPGVTHGMDGEIILEGEARREPNEAADSALRLPPPDHRHPPGL